MKAIDELLAYVIAFSMILFGYWRGGKNNGKKIQKEERTE